MTADSAGNTSSKISLTFEPHLAKVGPGGKCDAIVIYRAPAPQRVRVRGRLRALKARLDRIKESANPVQHRLFQSYEKLSANTSPQQGRLSFSTIGENTLPVAWAEVTPDSVEELARDPDVVAILPNLCIGLIRPRQVNYGALAKQENKDGYTWGLKELGIPKL